MLPVSLADMALLLSQVIEVFAPYLKMGLGVMFGFYVAYNVRGLLVDV